MCSSNFSGGTSPQGDTLTWPIGVLSKSLKDAQVSANETVKSLVLKGRGTVGSVGKFDYDSVEGAIRRATSRSIDSLKKLGEGSPNINKFNPSSTTSNGSANSNQTKSISRVQSTPDMLGLGLDSLEYQMRESKKMLRRKQQELQKQLGWGKDQSAATGSKVASAATGAVVAAPLVNTEPVLGAAGDMLENFRQEVQRTQQGLQQQLRKQQLQLGQVLGNLKAVPTLALVDAQAIAAYEQEQQQQLQLATATLSQEKDNEERRRGVKRTGPRATKEPATTAGVGGAASELSPSSTVFQQLVATDKASLGAAGAIVALGAAMAAHRPRLLHLKEELYAAQANRRRLKEERKQLDLESCHVNIVTTASLPWMTGTSINPLLRAAFLAQRNPNVTLVVPWLSRADQLKVFPNNLSFDTPAQQEEYVRTWLKRRLGSAPDFNIRFYPGRYITEKGSIFAVGDLTEVIPKSEAKVAVLEEPEHLNWYHYGDRWTEKFQHVVGIVHTNYLDYVRRESNGYMKKVLMSYVNRWVCRSYCHKVIKLSDAVQSLPRQQTCNVHGVAPHFLEIGDSFSKRLHDPAADSTSTPAQEFEKDAYFIGKCLWAKGYKELLDMMTREKRKGRAMFACDCYGSGEDKQAVMNRAAKANLPLNFFGARDHADASLQKYKIYINPSQSDVLCTSTAEALAMGKFAIIADNPSNQFFKQFRNCTLCKTPKDYQAAVERALATHPEPLSQQERYTLTWEAATDRFLAAAAVEPDGGPGALSSLTDKVLAQVHHVAASNERLRRLSGAGPETKRCNVEELMECSIRASQPVS